jgi:TRAP-type C4-dicarboxylate transport system substrate-binding protein
MMATMPSRCSILVLVVVAAFGTADLAAQEIRLKLHHLLPPVAIAHSAMLTPWKEKVERESGGRIAVDIYPSMHLGGQPPALIDQVREGIVDIVWTLPGYTPGRFPMIEVFELPFLNAQPVVTNYALADFIDNHPDEFAEYKVISAFVHAGQLIHSTQPIRRADDLRGLKIRIPTRVAGWMVESWGAIPLGTTVQKIPEMLSKGIVDGTLIPFEAAYGLQVHDLVSYNVFRDDPVAERFNGQVLMIVMNRDVYEGLAPDLRAVIDQNSGRNIARWIGEVWTEADRPGENAARAAGNEFIYLPDSEVAVLRELAEEPVASRWLAVVAEKGIDGRPLIAEAKALIEKYQSELGTN